jgi:hypothetical protein
MGQYCSRCNRTIKHSDKIILYIDNKRTRAYKKCFITKKEEIDDFKKLSHNPLSSEFKKNYFNPLTTSEQHALRER